MLPFPSARPPRALRLCGEPMSQLIRAFVAAEIDEDLRGELAAVIADLERVGAAVKWVAPGNLHWTVKFLGEVPMNEVGEISKAIREVAGAHEPIDGRVVGVAPFPDARRMRMVAARMEEQGRLGKIRDDLEPYMQEFGVPPDGRGFKAHLTMGRVKGSRNLRELSAALEPLAERDFGECRVEGLTLFMSELARSGPTYTRLARIPLGGA
jgi:2'-5' RNA ligase